ncbi:MAG TPA: FtsX-like permease family protein [Kineosporiaceae bacterium]|nr:FtsX-like permease family protein [Kineosporiaceae bacterium]
MLRLTLTQMRLNLGRLIAAGVAVMLGTAFVAATLLADDLIKQTMDASVSASYRGADVVVSNADAPASALAAVRRLPQVAGADAVSQVPVELVAGGRSETPLVGSLATTPELRTTRAATGRLPERPGEILLGKDLTDRLRLHVGDQVTARTLTWKDGAAAPTPQETRLTVVGLLAPTTGFALAPDAVATPSDVSRLLAEMGGRDRMSGLVVHAAAGVDPQQARDAVAAVGGWGEAAQIRTGADQIAADTRELTNGVDVLAAGLLAFAAVALFVAGLVITNTFQVLVAQRTRTLALLRCVGATRRQLRRGVLTEAGLLGLLSSLAGLLTGYALVTVVAQVLSHWQDVPIPATVRPTLLSVLLPLLVGLAVTVLAALSPARAATRVSPVAALRPAGAGGLRSRASRIRLGLSVGLLAVGAALLVVGARTSMDSHSTHGLPAGMAGGVISFLGVLIGGQLFIPRLVGLVGGLAGRFGGVPTRLAAANAVRNPRRTATTSAALLIGVTLVAMMATGAAVITATTDRALDTHYPVDVMIGDLPPGPEAEAAGPLTPVPAAVPAAVAKVPGVGESALLSAAQVQLSLASGSAGSGSWATAAAVDPARAKATLRDAGGLDGLAPGVVVVPREVARDAGRLQDGDLVRLTAGGRSVTLRARVTGLKVSAVVVVPADLRSVVPDAPTTMMWLRLTGDADARTVLDAVQEAMVTATGSARSVPVTGLAAERAALQNGINTLLLVVTGLLAVAVVIAMVGVANTLSLSVIERTRESAMLRALGLTRRQLRVTLAVEGALIAGIGALAGVVLGVLYGWAGAAAVIGGAWRPSLTVPAGQLALLLAGGVLAGLLASALPARRAARTSPVAALAE